MRQLKHRHLTWVADQIPPFLAHIQAVRYSPKTVRNYRYCLRAVERAIGLPLLIASATDLETYLAHLSRSKVTTATLAKAQNSLRVFFRWAVKYGHLRTDPTIGFESPHITHRLPRYLSESQVAQLLAGLPSDARDAAGIATLLYTGIRAGELVGLDIDDVRLDEGVIRVFGKGQRERLAPIPAPLRPYLDRWLAVHPAGTGALFVGRVPPFARQPYDTFARRFKTILAGIGLPGFTCHALRHTAATRWRRAGVPIEQIQLLLGHASVGTTMLYAHGALNEATRATLDQL